MPIKLPGGVTFWLPGEMPGQKPPSQTIEKTALKPPVLNKPGSVILPVISAIPAPGQPGHAAPYLSIKPVIPKKRMGSPGSDWPFTGGR